MGDHEGVDPKGLGNGQEAHWPVFTERRSPPHEALVLEIKEGPFVQKAAKVLI